MEDMLGSKTKIKILRTLMKFETKKFTSRELAQRLDVSHTAVLKSIPALEDMNIIQKEQHGNSNLILLNKESYCFAILKNIFSEEEKTTTELIKMIKEYFGDKNTIILFGSIIHKKEEASSDIDLLIIDIHQSVADELSGLRTSCCKS